MSRPLSLSFIFANEAGNQPASQLDTNFNTCLSLQDSASGWVNYAVDTGSANTYACTLNPAPSGYITGFTVLLQAATTNTGASTINVNGLGAKSIVRPNGGVLAIGDLPAGITVPLVYDGTFFRIIAIPKQPLISIQNATGDITVEAKNASALWVNVTVTSGPGMLTTINNLGPGVPVEFIFTNSTLSAITNKITVNSPGGGAYSQVLAYRGGLVGGAGATDLQVTGFGVNSGNTFILHGISGLTLGGAGLLQVSF